MFLENHRKNTTTIIHKLQEEVKKMTDDLTKHKIDLDATVDAKSALEGELHEVRQKHQDDTQQLQDEHNRILKEKTRRNRSTKSRITEVDRGH